MSVSVKIGSTWRNVDQLYIKIGDAWRKVSNVFTKVSGQWKPSYSYSWSIGAWSACSANCGGGTQSRVVTCVRNDGKTVEDFLCGSKPDTSQVCNTQACQPVSECQYIYGGSGPQYYWAIGGGFHLVFWGTILNNGSYLVGPDDTTTVNGYKYSKSTFMFRDKNYNSYYQICRKPV